MDLHGRPIAARSEEHNVSEASPVQPAAIPASDKSVLIVDDDTLMRRLLQQTFNRTGARLRQAASGDDALRELATAPADLMVIDVTMPGRDGYDIIRTVRADARHANMPVILLTAGDLAEARSKAAGLGVTDFCTKPFVPSVLAARAKAILES